MLDGQGSDGSGATPDYERAFSQLCHLAALNRTDMVDGAIEKLALTTLVIDSATRYRDVASLGDAVFVLFGVRLTDDQLQHALDELLDAGAINRDLAGNIVVVAETQAATSAQIEEARALESDVRQEWLDEVAGRLPNAEIQAPLWQALQRYLALAFRRHGAETAQLLDPNSRYATPTGTLSAYLDQAIDEAGLRSHRAIAGEAIDLFLAGSTPKRTTYLAQLLDGTFTFFALTLDEATSAYLRGTLSSLNLFLDTNYIFGLLDLHQNYFVRASKELVRLIQENGLPFHLYYHEFTYREIERTLTAQADRLRSRRWAVALSRAAIQIDTLDGLERLYHQINAATPTDVDAFLSKYENVPLLLKPLGIDIYRLAGVDPFTTVEKGLLIADYQAFLERFAPRPRSYAAIDHDASLWLALRSLRNPGGTVLDSGALIVTNDYWLNRFDKSLGPNATVSSPGAVVLPAQLLQLLRPLVPATDDFDRRFVETFALPEFRTAQSGYSATSSKVLSYLATYKDLPTETAAAILKSHALASRLKGLDESAPEFRDAIESEIIELNRSLLEEKVQLGQELEAARTGVSETAVVEVLTSPGPESPDAGVSAAALEGRAERAERSLTWTLRALGGLLFVFGALLIYVGPTLVAWDALDQHPHAAGLRLALLVAWGALCWLVAVRGRSGLVGAAVGVVIGALLAITQIL